MGKIFQAEVLVTQKHIVKVEAVNKLQALEMCEDGKWHETSKVISNTIAVCSIKQVMDSAYSVVLHCGEVVTVAGEETFKELENDKPYQYTPDIIATLCKYYDSRTIKKWDIELINDRFIFDTPIKQLIQDHYLYKYISTNYGKNNREE
jgi:hypothetical protein